MLLALMLAAAPALPVEVVGFSPDDKYVAFIEHGVGEGSGYPWAKLRIFEIAKSVDALVPPVEVTLDSGKDTDTEAAAIKQAKASLDGARKTLKIASWAPPRVIPFDEHGEMADHEGAPIGTVKIDLHTLKKGAPKCDAPLKPELARLTVYFVDDDKPVRFADEKKLPADRSCTTGCTLAAVFAHGKVALMFTSCQVQGGEGPAQKYTAYSGKLTYGLDEPLPPQ